MPLAAAARALRLMLGLAPQPAAAILPGNAARDGDEVAALELAEAARGALRAWTPMLDRVQTIRDGVTTPLYVWHDLTDPRQAQTRVIDEACNALHFTTRLQQQASDALEADAFPDVPLNPSLFVAHAHAGWRVLAALGRSATARFLDVGAGSGSKVVIAARIFAEADGLERDPGYAAAGARILGGRLTGNARNIEGDALTFEGYGDCDLIYMYHPIRSTTRMQALEDRVVSMARPGTVLFAPYAGFFERVGELGVQRLSGSLAITGMTAGAAEALARDATRIGPLLPGPEALTLRPGEGLFAPLIHALRLNGYSE